MCVCAFDKLEKKPMKKQAPTRPSADKKPINLSKSLPKAKPLFITLKLWTMPILCNASDAMSKIKIVLKLYNIVHNLNCRK